MTPRFKNRDGSLTAYAFACGYIQRASLGDVDLQLYKDGCWHVRAFDSERTLLWDCFGSLSKARKRFDAAKREFKSR